MRICLHFTIPSGACVDARALSPRAVLPLAEREIERLMLPSTNGPLALGEIGRVECSQAGPDELVLGGDTPRLDFIGRGMDGGRLVVEGGAGDGAGMGMAGGELEIVGGAGEDAGAGMQAGLLHIYGSAGDFCGACRPDRRVGMTGGVIWVGGDAGRFAGMGMRRGLMWMDGSVGEYCGERMLAGSIFCAGEIAQFAGRGNLRGSIVAGRLRALLPGYLAAGKADIEWLRLVWVNLSRLGVKPPPAWLERSPLRFTGDALELGKGELLAYDLVE